MKKLTCSSIIFVIVLISTSIRCFADCSYELYYRMRPDVKKENKDALEHYNSEGEKQGMCKPNKSLDDSDKDAKTCTYKEYFDKRPDVKKVNGDALVHYYNHGKKEGMCKPIISSSEVINPKSCTVKEYYSKRGDVKNASYDAVAHYERHGKFEGMCKPIPETSADGTCTYEEYYEKRPDVETAGMDAFEHYQRYGETVGLCRPVTESIPVGEVTKVFEGPTDTYKMVGMLGSSYGLFVTISNVYKGKNKSKIYLDHKLLYEGTQETIGQPFLHNNKVYFPVEHGSNALVYYNGKISTAAKAAGRWSVVGGVFQDQPFVAYNNKFSGSSFSDKPKIYNVETGALIFEFNGLTMSRSFAVHDDILWSTGTFGEQVLMNTLGKKYKSPALMIESFNGSLYGGGGVDAGPKKGSDGKIYKFNGSTWKSIHNTGCHSIQSMVVIDSSLYFAGTDPDRLVRMDKNEKFSVVAEIKGETAAHQQRSFGAAVAKHDGYFYWGRSDLKRAYVYKIAASNPSSSSSGNEIVFEAEEFASKKSTAVVSAEGASGGKAIQFDSSSNGRVNYNIEVPKTGTYLVSIRTMAHDSENNGLHIYYDEEIQKAPSGHKYAGVTDIFLSKGKSWFDTLQWQGSGHGAVKGPVKIKLKKGKHTFAISKRKIERPLIDKITLTLQAD